MAALGVTSGTVSVRLERLRSAGLIEPAEGATDDRFRPVRLTDEGSRRWRAATDDRVAFEERLFQRAFNAVEIEYLNQLLRWLLTEFETETEAPVARSEAGSGRSSRSTSLPTEGRVLLH